MISKKNLFLSLTVLVTLSVCSHSFAMNNGKYIFDEHDPLFSACKNGNLDMVKSLIENGDNPNTIDVTFEGTTPLFQACIKNDTKIVEFLLPFCKETIILKTHNVTGQNIMHVACFNRDFELAKFLLSCPHLKNNNKALLKQLINQSDKSGKTPLYYACEKKKCIEEGLSLYPNEKNNFKIVELLLPYCSDETIRKADKLGNTPLDLTLSYDDPKTAMLLLSRYTKDMLTETNEQGIPLLHLIFCNKSWNNKWKNDRKILTELLKRKDLELNETDNNGETLLFLAYKNNDLEITKFLLENGARKSINIANNNGETPLYLACKNNNMEFVKLFLEKAYPEPGKVKSLESLNITLEDSETLLDLALNKDNLAYYKKNNLCNKINLELIKLLAPLYSNNALLGVKVLDFALDQDNLELVQFLLPIYANNNLILEIAIQKAFLNAHNIFAKAISDTKTLYVKNEFTKTISDSTFELVKLLLPFCCKKLIPETDKDSIELNKIYTHNINLIEKVVDEAFKMKEKTKEFYAEWSDNYFEFIKLLFPFYPKKSINKIEYGYTKLNLACHRNKYRIAKLLLLNGARGSIDTCDYNGRSPIFWACCSNNTDTAYLLFQLGISKETINKVVSGGKKYTYECGWTPLNIACNKNNIDIANILLYSGAQESVNKANEKNETPLYWACENNNIELVKLLLKHGAKESINKVASEDKNTPLYLACKNNNTEIVKLLLENGARESVNKAVPGDKDTPLTPLEVAIRKNNLKIVKILLENGAEVRDKALEIAKENGPVMLKNLCTFVGIAQEAYIPKYLQLVADYDKLNSPQIMKTVQNKTQFVIARKIDSEIFKFLIRLAFGRFINKIEQEKSSLTKSKLAESTVIESTVFGKLYENEEMLSSDDLEKIFGVRRRSNIYEFLGMASKTNYFSLNQDKEIKNLVEKNVISGLGEKIKKNNKFKDCHITIS